jgi:hypothetical protein
MTECPHGTGVAGSRRPPTRGSWSESCARSSSFKLPEIPQLVKYTYMCRIGVQEVPVSCEACVPFFLDDQLKKRCLLFIKAAFRRHEASFINEDGGYRGLGIN